MTVQQLTSNDQIEEYLALAKVECLICHNKYTSLGVHVKHAHGISARNYKIMHGIPVGESLNGSGLTKYLREKKAAILARNPYEVERLKDMSRCYQKTAVNKPKVALSKASKRALAERSKRASEVILGVLNSPEETTCTNCGKSFTAKTASAARRSDARCPRCRRAYTRVQDRNQYRKENPMIHNPMQIREERANRLISTLRAERTRKFKVPDVERVLGISKTISQMLVRWMAECGIVTRVTDGRGRGEGGAVYRLLPVCARGQKG